MFAKRWDGCQSFQRYKLIILNDSSSAYMCPEYLSELDLALTTANILFCRFVWEIILDRFGSDHASIKITVTGTATIWRLRWIIPKDNWREFANNCVRETNHLVNIELCVERLTAAINNSALGSTSVISSTRRRQNVPLWNESCKALQERRESCKMVRKDAFFGKLLPEGSSRPFVGFCGKTTSANFLEPHSWVIWVRGSALYVGGQKVEIGLAI